MKKRLTLVPRKAKEVAHDTKQVYFFMAIEKKNHDVPGKIRSILGWSIAATILGFWPLGIFAIIKAAKCKKLWESNDYEKADSVWRMADCLSLATIMIGLSISTILFFIFRYNSVISSLPLVLSLILWWFGLAGMNEGRDRICGLSGGFILGMLPVLGLFLISRLQIKGHNTMISYNKQQSSVLGWAIAATTLGFWPIGIIAIVKAIKSQKLWQDKKYEQSDTNAKTADILSVISVVSAYVIFVSFSFISGMAVNASIIIIALLILVLSGLIGMLEGMHRSCGYAGGFILGMFPIIGWIMVSTFSWKGEIPDAWIDNKPQFV